jgi:nitroreductase
MDFLQIVGDRRSIRWYKTWEKVSSDKIQRILEVARLTTCPGNLQPWRAVVVDRDELEEKTREELLSASNWQGGHTQAPVWIYWYADPLRARPESFATKVLELIDVGATPRAYGYSPESVKGAIEKGTEAPEGMPPIGEGLHGLPTEISAVIAASETVGACAVAVLAAVNEGLGTALHAIARPSKQERVKEILGVPAQCVPVWLQLVGYSLESPKAGGQRPREPFEDLFFKGKWGIPYERNQGVVEQLKKEGLLQAQAPLPGRFEELRYLARMYGYPSD